MKTSLTGLETLFWVVRLKSFTAAAQRLHLSQSAISIRIRDLEDSLGVRLLDRSTSGFRLTSAGRTCMRYADRMLSLHAELHRRAGDEFTISGKVNLGISESIALTWLPELISRLGSRYPQVTLELDVDVNTVLWDRFRRGELDCIFVPGPVHDRDVVIEFLGELTFSWMASPALTISHEELTFRELSRLPIVTLSQGSNLYEAIQNWFADNRSRPRRVFLCNSLGVVIALAKCGVGIALLPEDLVRGEIERGVLTVLPVRNTSIRMNYLCVYPVRGANAATKLISTLARQTSTFVTPAKDHAHG